MSPNVRVHFNRDSAVGLLRLRRRSNKYRPGKIDPSLIAQ